MTIDTLEDLLSVFATTTEVDRMAKFAEGDALILATEPTTRAALGFRSNKALYAAVGAAVGRSKRTLEYLVSTARAFAPDERSAQVAFDVYRECASTDAPLVWLERAALGHLSADKVRHEYKALTGKPLATVDIEYITRTADATITVCENGRMVLRFDETVRASEGERVQVTITRTVARGGSVQEPAREARAA